MNLKAYHNDPKIKAKYLKRVRAHAKADEIIKGQYWNKGKGCAVGCTIHDSSHAKYETELGIPEWLARVEDILFEGMSKARAKKWPEQFLKAIKPGAKLEKIKIPFLICILESSLESMFATKYDKEKYPQVKQAIQQSENAVTQMITALKSNDRGAISAAWSAASAARSAAESAAYEKFADKLLVLLKNCK